MADNPYTDFKFYLVNTKTGEKKKNTVALADHSAFEQFLVKSNLSAPTGWAFMREEDIDGSKNKGS